LCAGPNINSPKRRRVQSSLSPFRKHQLPHPIPRSSMHLSVYSRKTCRCQYNWNIRRQYFYFHWYSFLA